MYPILIVLLTPVVLLLADTIFLRWRMHQLRGMFTIMHLAEAGKVLARTVCHNTEHVLFLFHQCYVCCNKTDITELDFTTCTDNIVASLHPSLREAIRHACRIPIMVSWEDWIWLHKVALRTSEWRKLMNTASQALLLFVVELDSCLTPAVRAEIEKSSP